MSVETLRNDVERLWAAGSDGSKDEGREVFARLRAALSAGTVRAASPDTVILIDEAWAKLKGTSSEKAMADYVKLVDRVRRD